MDCPRKLQVLRESKPACINILLMLYSSSYNLKPCLIGIKTLQQTDQSILNSLTHPQLHYKHL